MPNASAIEQQPDQLLRTMTLEQFEAAYGTDRFTATVLSNRLRYAVQHVATGLLYRAFSPIIALAMDFVGAICAPAEQDYRMISVTNGLTVFLGTLQDGVRAAVEEFGPDRLVPGDLLVCNDTSRMGNHPNDVCFIRPIFHDDRIVSFMVLRAHLIDVGGITPGGFNANKKNTYENGLQISPRLLYHAEEPVHETFSLIFDNSRFGQVQLPDYATIKSCCRLGEELVTESIDRYGLDAYLGTLRYACDATAERMRAAFEALPDDDYVGEALIDADGIDADEEYRLRLKLKKRGPRAEVDLSGTSRQARTAINGGPLDAKTAIGVGLKEMLDPKGDFTSGVFRDIDLVIPPGSIASALPPDGPVFFYFEVGSALVAALIDALADALGDAAFAGDCGCHNVHNGFGTHPDGTPWACSSVAGAETGPVGANSKADGEGHLCPYTINILSPASELLEAEYPVMIMRKEYTCDSNGPGTKRGGAAILKDIMWTSRAEHTTAPLRFRRPSGIGVQGGADGGQGGIWIFGAAGRDLEVESAFVEVDESVYAEATPVSGMLDPETNVLDPSGEFAYYNSETWRTEANATWRYINNGGGGFGSPLERDPEAVMRDVRDEYVSIGGALENFGVVISGDPAIDPEGLQIDFEATTKRRSQ